MTVQADRRVGAGQLLEDGHRVGELGVEPTVAARQQRPEATGRHQLVHEIDGDPSPLLDLVGASRDRRHEAGDRVGHVTERRRLALDDAHASGPPHGRSIGASAACLARSSSSHPPLQ